MRMGVETNTHYGYEDTGCALHPACLSCPRPRCAEEEARAVRAALNEDRNREILKLWWEGVRLKAIAEAFDLSERTIYRVLSRGIDGGT